MRKNQMEQSRSTYKTIELGVAHPGLQEVVAVLGEPGVEEPGANYDNRCGQLVRSPDWDCGSAPPRPPAALELSMSLNSYVRESKVLTALPGF